MVIEAFRSQYLICYASQKGTAQSIAEDLSEQCSNSDLKIPCHLSCISELKSINRFQDFYCVIFIGSTTGDGDPPEAARKFMRELKDAVSKVSLSWLHYTVLGLGDTNYTNFCNFGKSLDRLLQSGKAVRFYNCGWADDGTGLEIVVEPWIEGLFPVLKKFLDSPLAKRQELLRAEPNLFEITNNSSLPVELPSNLTVMTSNEESFEMSKEESLTMKNFKELFPVLNLPDDDEISNHSVKKLKFSSVDTLTLPNISASYLLTEFSNEKSTINHKDIISKDEIIKYPSTASDIYSCRISSCRRLTTDDAVKKALEISLKSRAGDKFDYEPGDSFGIIVSNKVEEVELLLRLLHIYDRADFIVRLKVDPNTSKKAAGVPKYIPKECTLRYLFTHCLDIRTVPKKLFLRALVEHTSEPVERKRMMELASREGSEEYNQFVRTQGLTFLDLLILFPSCHPPVSLVCEHLPRLLPRPYSITSSPLVSSDEISFVFNIIEIPKNGSITFSRQGLCTGWLSSLTIDQMNENDLHSSLEKLSLEKDNTEDILIYFRCHQNFRLPKEISLPLIMIGPGTGVAPFIGFLKHREAQIKAAAETNSSLEMRLFFGCRHQERDFLYNKELSSFGESNILRNLYVSFSRDEKQNSEPKYVQDNLALHGEEIIDLISNKNAAIYVCGDAKNMSRNVFDTFVNLLQKFSELTELDARKFIAQMQLNNRYMQDVWA